VKADRLSNRCRKLSRQKKITQQCHGWNPYGENWQEEYYIWDCCAGTCNLLVGLAEKHRIWASTIDQPDVDIVHEIIDNHRLNLLKKHVFQFDFLNDDFSKLPKSLREIINDPEKRQRLIIYMNPPYAEGGSSRQM
jgi:tRNA1(Val) A37 N6-methylase TrmN6